MNVPKNLPSILSVLSIVFSVAGLVFSPASAAANPPAINGPGPAAAWYGIHGTFNATLQEDHLQTELTSLGQQGVDVTQPQADLASGNVTAAVQWLRGYLRTSPGAGPTGTRSQRFNSTALNEHLQTELTNLGQQGVDVTQPQADLASGNVTAAVQWLRGYLRTSPGALGKMNGGQSAGGNAWKGPGFAWHRPSHHVWNTGSAA